MIGFIKLILAFLFVHVIYSNSTIVGIDDNFYFLGLCILAAGFIIYRGKETYDERTGNTSRE